MLMEKIGEKKKKLKLICPGLPTPDESKIQKKKINIASSGIANPE